MARKPGIQLDWFNVTYRSVALVVGLVLLVGALGAGAWFWLFAKGPHDEAERAVRSATIALREAEGLPDDVRIDEIRDNARVALHEAAARLDEREWETARIAAIKSENLSRQALRLARGDKPNAAMVRFYRVEGDVRVKRRGEFAWEAADRKMVLSVGDQVKTSTKASAQLIYFNGTVTTIRPGSLLEIRQLHEDPLTKVQKVTEKLSWGELNSSTRQRNVEGSYHEVATEKVAARADREGEFRIKFDKSRKTAAFDVIDGALDVSSSDRRENLVAGERLRTSADGRLLPKELVPGIPRLTSPSDEKVFVDEDPSRVRINLSWKPVAGAGSYRLMISDKMLFSDPLYDAVREETSAVLDGVHAGDYFWQVAAISANGVAGEFTPARRFRVSSQAIRDRGDTTPPPLEISEFVAVGPMLIINGKTEPGASLWIDSDKVDVSDDGSFYAVVRLKQEGVNKVRFVAQDNAGNERRESREAYIESY